jgi:hypothetical protein
MLPRINSRRSELASPHLCLANIRSRSLASNNHALPNKPAINVTVAQCSPIVTISNRLPLSPTRG